MATVKIGSGQRVLTYGRYMYNKNNVSLPSTGLGTIFSISYNRSEIL